MWVYIYFQRNEMDCDISPARIYVSICLIISFRLFMAWPLLYECWTVVHNASSNKQTEIIAAWNPNSFSCYEWQRFALKGSIFEMISVDVLWKTWNLNCANIIRWIITWFDIIIVKIVDLSVGVIDLFLSSTSFFTWY